MKKRTVCVLCAIGFLIILGLFFILNSVEITMEPGMEMTFYPTELGELLGMKEETVSSEDEPVKKVIFLYLIDSFDGKMTITQPIQPSDVSA